MHPSHRGSYVCVGFWLSAAAVTGTQLSLAQLAAPCAVWELSCYASAVVYVGCICSCDDATRVWRSVHASAQYKQQACLTACPGIVGAAHELYVEFEVCRSFAPGLQHSASVAHVPQCNEQTRDHPCRVDSMLQWL